MIITPGTKVINSSGTIDDFGSIGGSVIHKGTTYLMTCFHCVYNPNMDWTSIKQEGNTSVSFWADERLVLGGEIKFTMRNDTVDIALLQLKPGFEIENNIPEIGQITGFGFLDKDDKHKTWVSKYGAKTKYTEGVFLGTFPQLGAPYPPDKKIHHLSNLLMFESKGYKPFAEKGDSGSWIIDSKNKLVGVVVMVRGRITFALSVNSIINSISLSI